MRILLVSTYELGHQPVHVASPASVLRSNGHDVRAVDVSVQPWDKSLVEWADGVAFSVPMHTAMRMAVALAARVRAQRAEVPICFYGLYAAMNGDSAAATTADRIIVGEYEPGLSAWADEISAVDKLDRLGGVVVHLGRSRFKVPARDLLPPLESYARLVLGDEKLLTAAVEASHGCSHRCRHCPLPVVYDGRLRIVPEDVVLADVAQLVAMGARHLTFADPDFLNGPRHAIRVVNAVHSSFPDLSFDCTTKVEHILNHEDLWPGLAKAGCLFVVSAFESVDAATLRILDKRHTADDASKAITVLRKQGIEVRASWLPFTPWTKASELVAMFDFVVAHDLVGNVDPVQYTIRLLLPEGSLLLSAPEVKRRPSHYDTERLSWVWTAEHAELDELQSKLAAFVESTSSGSAAFDQEEVFVEVRDRVLAFASLAGRNRASTCPRRGSASSGPAGPRPRLSEPWFCCSEPTLTQQAAVTAGATDVSATRWSEL